MTNRSVRMMASNFQWADHVLRVSRADTRQSLRDHSFATARFDATVQLVDDEFVHHQPFICGYSWLANFRVVRVGSH